MALDAADNTAIQALIAAALAENGGVLSKQEFGATAAMIRNMNTSIEGIRTNNPMDVLVAAGVLEKKADGTYGQKVTAAAPAKKDDPNAALQAQIDSLREQGLAKDKAIAAANETQAATEMKSAVIAAFEKAGALAANRDYVHVMPNVKRGADGVYHVASKDQFGVDVQTPLDTAFGTFLTGNPELKKAAGKPGSGTPAGTPSTGTSTMTTAQYMADRTKNLASGDLKVTF